MGKHITASELDEMFEWKADGVGPATIHEKMSALRRRQRRPVPDLTTVRRALEGKTFKRGKAETRGRKRTYTSTNLKRINEVRQVEYKKAEGERELRLDYIVKKARVPTAHRTTVARNLIEAGYPVKYRPPRQKPMRSEIDEAERKKVCGKLMKRPASYWQKVHLYMDNKRWDVPTTAKGKRFLKMKKVRGHWRTRAEGLKKEFTKPNVKKHTVTTCGSANVCAGIVNGRVRARRS